MKKIYLLNKINADHIEIENLLSNFKSKEYIVDIYNDDELSLIFIDDHFINGLAPSADDFVAIVDETLVNTKYTLVQLINVETLTAWNINPEAIKFINDCLFQVK